MPGTRRFNCKKGSAIIRQIVGRLPTSASDTEVADYAASRLKPEAPPSFVASVKKCAVKVHHENQRLYRSVMGGRFGSARRRRRR